MKTLAIITQPATEPLTLQEVKDYLKRPFSDQDAYLTSLIVAVRQNLENYCSSSFINQTLKLSQDCFDSKQISLWKSPVSSITSLKVFDSENAESTISNTMYFLHDNFLNLNQNFSLDVTLREFSGVQITYVAGYGASASNVPQAIRQAILEQINAIYECECELNQICAKSKALLSSYIKYNHWSS